MEKIHIIIVDDHKIVRQGLKALLIGEKQIKIIAEAASADELFEELKNKTPNLIVLDIGLPGISGIDIAKTLSREYPRIKTIMLSANIDEENITASVKAGANGFLPKDTSREELIEAVTKVYSGQDYFGEGISHIIYKSYVKTIKSKKNPAVALSEREIEVVKLLCEGLGHKQIAEKLFISVRTVETHKKNILEKLNLQNSVELVKFAIKTGMIEL